MKILGVTATMQFDASQCTAIKAACKWHKTDPTSRAPFFLIKGSAGSGKSSIVQYIISELGLKKVVCCAPTGKAANVMRGKGFPKARTVHSLLYRPTGSTGNDKKTREIHAKLDKREDELRAMAMPEEDIALDPEVKRLKWDLRRERDKPLFEMAVSEEAEDADLIVLSEASMVGEGMARDLLKLQKPLLIEGDPFQLDPIEGLPYFMTEAQRENSFTLDVIHRQAEGSPILDMAKLARMGAELKVGSYGDGCAVVTKLDPSEALAANQIIVGRNLTRHKKNWAYRILKGYVSEDMRPHQEFLPRPGERMICRKNDHDRGLLNGSFWECLEASEDDEDVVNLSLSSLDEGEQTEVECRAHRELLTGPAQRELPIYKARAKGIQRFDFGYVVTCHSSQGGQWDSVVVYDESGQFQDSRKWLYTAVTRAAKKLIVVKT